MAQNVQSSPVDECVDFCWSAQRTISTISLVTHRERNLAMLMCRVSAVARANRVPAPDRTALSVRNRPRASDAQDRLSANNPVAPALSGGWRCDSKADCSTDGALAPEFAAC